ncbi:MAG: hypothetical protein KHX05_01460 [Firmicutes bacterium]|nr:hypothetical protein [Bacillota bacterium]
MDWNSFIQSKYLRGGLCALLIAAILLGLWLPGTGLKEAQPDDPLQGESVREITALKLGENGQQLNTVSVPDGGQSGSAEPRPEETRPDSAPDDGDDGQENGNQGADGGEVSPSELSLVLTWNAKGIACAAGNTQAFSVSSYELNEDLFRFRVSLTGTQAQDAKIVGGVSVTESTQTAKELTWPSGSLPMTPAAGTDKEVYEVSFTVRTPERDVFFRYKITYQKLPDVQLSFTWRGTGNHKGTLLCLPNGSVADKIKNNQLAGGGISYEMKLVGSDAERAGARIMSASYTSDGASGSGELDARNGQGFLPMTMSAGETSNTYRISVSALANGHPAHFEVILHYGNDVTLEMRYTLNDGSERSVFCQNKQLRTADTVYDNQLTDGFLEYEMSIVGSDADGVKITSVTCNQSGSVETLNQLERGRIRLLLNAGKAGHNFFEIKAQGENEYSFTIDIPYKHKGTKSVEILLNLEDQDEIPNESKTTLRVTAHGKDAQGNTVSIPAKGTNEFIQVSLDGIEAVDPTRSGDRWEYGLIPSNPETGDRNEHTLYVYAEDAYGNWGEEKLTLIGFRVEPGQKIGDATIYVDMTVLGVGVVGPIPYEVLADEPISYVVAKAIMGKDTGEPFGAATKGTLHWRGDYGGTLDTGFYLRSLNTDYHADALEDAVWPGSTEEEVLDAIDARFGAGTGLAVLWRCLYRNGLNKSAGSGSTFGEFDYTSGSGWMYSIGGSYYPGQSMSAVRLKDEDVLTLRYTLAYGWDIGGGSDNYGNIVGYCVTAINGDITPRHQMEEVEDPDGSIHYVCRCCGMVQDCPHAHTTYKDLEDGTHILLCEDCQAAIGDPLPHNWTYAAGDTEDSHVCAECGAAERHFWKEVEGTNTATCTEPGVRTVRCSVCGMEKEEEAEAKGHTLDNRWNHTALEHYQKCSTCGEEFDRGNHEYTYSEDWDEYECRICHVLHEEICGGALTIQEATCQKIVYHCDSCGYDMTKPGTFDEYHDYVDGICQYCGGEDPDHVPHEHAYHETQRVEPTCTEDGYIQHTCDCGDTYREPLPATGHTWGEWSPAGDGKEVRYCDACGAEDYRTSEEDTYSVQMLFLHWLFPRIHQK